MRYYFQVIENREILWIFHKKKSLIAFMFKKNFTTIVLIIITIRKTKRTKESVYKKIWLILINLWIIKSLKGAIQVKNF
jgi:hypothetical protein